MFVPRSVMARKLIRLLAEDIGQGDVTTSALIPLDLRAEAEVLVKADGVVAGIEEGVVLLEALGLAVETGVSDGEVLKKGQVILRIRGSARTILSSERTLLNLLSRMSGIATVTRRFVDKLREANLKAKVAATRKSAPGLMYFDKKAVFVGGGDPHRLHLDDLILIKDNHLALSLGIEEAVSKAKMYGSFTKKIEIEVTNTNDALAAAEAGADIVMLDNFSVKEANQAVEAFQRAGFTGKVLLEASGGITESTLLDYASAGIDVLSIGELTHSVKGLNLSLEILRRT